MNLKKVLTEDTIRLDLKAETKQELIEELLDVLVATGHVTDRKTALRLLLERENKMSTGMQHGLALPHAKCEGVDRLVAVLGLKKSGMDFQSMDHELSRIFILSLSPLNRAGPHIQFLAEIGRKISNPAIRERLLAATGPGDVIDALGDDETLSPPAP